MLLSPPAQVLFPTATVTVPAATKLASRLPFGAFTPGFSPTSIAPSRSLPLPDAL